MDTYSDWSIFPNAPLSSKAATHFNLQLSNFILFNLTITSRAGLINHCTILRLTTFGQQHFRGN